MEETLTLNAADAAKLINKARKAKFYASVSASLPIAGQAGQVFPSFAVVSISKSQALSLVASLLQHFTERGAMVTIEHHKHEYVECYYIG